MTELELLELPDELWRLDALCAQTDPEIFFPAKGERALDAKDVCGRCAVTQQCLAFAMGNRVAYGVWGGLSADERKKYPRRQRRDAS